MNKIIEWCSDLNYLSEKKNKLYINGKEYSELLKDFSGAVYIINHKRIKDNCIFIKETLNSISQKNYLLCYAMKVAPSKDILETMKSEGIGVEVYSKNELDMALNVGISPIVVDGFYKTDEFILEAIKNKVLLINADSIDELKRINTIAKQNNVVQQVGVRVKYKSDSKMGIDLAELKIEISNLKKLKNIKIVGVHTHPGSNIVDNSILDEHYSRINEAARLLKEQGFSTKYIDFGGGIPEKNVIKSNLTERLSKTFRKFEDLNATYILELGRFFVGDAGMLFGKIHEIREREKIIMLNISVAPYFLNTKSHFIYLFPEQVRYKERGKWKICGIWPTDLDCIEPNFLYIGTPNNVNSGEYFCFLNAGAYNYDRLNEYVLNENINIIHI